MSDSEVREGLHYTNEHEWILVEDGIATIGITDFAQNSLSDLVYVELPEVGTEISKGDTPVIVESCKAASDVYAPLSGKVVEVNQSLTNDPGKVNREPYDGGWLIKVRLADPSELEDTMDSDDYTNYL
jgi:glycine cleavage system H protein